MGKHLPTYLPTYLSKCLKRLAYILLFHLRYKCSFKYISHKSTLIKSLKVDGAKNIEIHAGVAIGKYSWIAAMDHGNTIQPSLIFNEGCRIGNFNHIYSTGSIIFEKNVLTADKVYISNNLHEYEDITLPIHSQPIKHLKNMIIGEGSWLGENVCVIGASIGKGSVIGANSVVTKDIPDYCVAVGAPAKVIKKYNHITKQWEKVS